MKNIFNTLKKGKFLYFFGLTTLIYCQSAGGGDTPGGGGTTPPTTTGPTASVWMTKSDESAKIKKQTDLTFNAKPNLFNTIEVNPSQIFQSIDGFGYTLTGGSVEVINNLSPAKKDQLLQEVFGLGENGIGVSYLRLSIGASDLNSSVFSYNDLPAGETDLTLSKFSMAKDQPVIDMLKKILAINPNIKLMATPWSPPVWMKDNGSTIGGSLKPEYLGVYAQYFVKYIQTMKANGITIDAITPQNEPLHPGNNPSLLMLAEQQGEFIKNHLGPAFKAAGITTKIVIYDHNLDNITYATTILKDAAANPYVDGTAFHLYNGDISAMGTLYNAFSGKNVYFTEQYTPSNGSFGGDFMWHTKNVIIGSMRNYSKTALEWNLANNGSFQPYTPGGCTVCKGAVTISGDAFEKNVGYYIIGQASKFVPANSQRIESSQSGNLSSTAFITPAGKIAVIIQNEGTSPENFNIKYKGNSALTTLPAQSVATYVFDK